MSLSGGDSDPEVSVSGEDSDECIGYGGPALGVLKTSREVERVTARSAE